MSKIDNVFTTLTTATSVASLLESSGISLDNLSGVMRERSSQSQIVLGALLLATSVFSDLQKTRAKSALDSAIAARDRPIRARKR